MNKQRLHTIATNCAVVVLEQPQIVMEHIKSNNLIVLLTRDVIKKALIKTNTPLSSHDKEVIDMIMEDKYVQSVFIESIKSNFSKIKLYY